MGRGGRVLVDDSLRVVDHPEVFVAGDLAYLEHEGEPLPQVAPVAIQTGEAAAANVLRSLRGQPLVPFEYEDPGMLAVIGRYAAVAEIKGFKGSGLIAWCVWALVHIAKLIGFRNRALVLVNWAWNYLSFRRAPRLILPGVGVDEDDAREGSEVGQIDDRGREVVNLG